MYSLKEGHHVGYHRMSIESNNSSSTVKWHLLPGFLWIYASPWMLCSMLILVCLYLINSNGKPCQCMESFEKGFKTDFKPAISAIKVQQIRFTSSLKLNESGEWYRVQDPTKPTYVGTPSPDIDHAWNTLLTGRYVNLTGTQKADLESEGVIQEFHHGFYAGPDVFHSLHCLNALRKVIYKDYYAEEIKSDFGLQSLHIDHCMDQLRQAVQCAGDLTPVTIVPVYNGTLGLGETERTHTCRNFQSLLDWKAELKTAKLP